MMKASTFFTKEEQEKLLESIREAEKETSGEIRIHIETKVKGHALHRAARIFFRLGMDKTANRNGVLFYLAVKDRKFAILGDKGIHDKVPAGFWDNISEILTKNFKEGLFTEGLSEGIILAGHQLKTHFPCRQDDINELPDDISFDNVKENRHGKK